MTSQHHERVVYLNGKYLPPEQATISVFDRGFLFADGVYEVIPVYGGQIFHLPEHLQRLSNSLEGIRLANPLADDEWTSLLQDLVKRNGDGDLYIYLQVTRGSAPRDHAFPAEISPTVFAMVNPLKPVADDILAQGLPAVTLADNRWLRCDIKSVALLGNVLLRQRAVESGAGESILIRDGIVTEGAASNVFIVSDGVIMTPPRNHLILPGITRDIVINLARVHGHQVRETDISETQLRAADEIWLTSSTKAILPVTRLDGNSVANGLPGPMWQTMIKHYNQAIEQLRQSNAPLPA